MGTIEIAGYDVDTRVALALGAAGVGVFLLAANRGEPAETVTVGELRPAEGLTWRDVIGDADTSGRLIGPGGPPGPPGPGPTPTPTTCTTDAGCATGYRCINSRCVRLTGSQCQSGTDCPTGQRCKDGQCIPVHVRDPEHGKDCRHGLDCKKDEICERGTCRKKHVKDDPRDGRRPRQPDRKDPHKDPRHNNARDHLRRREARRHDQRQDQHDDRQDRRDEQQRRERQQDHREHRQDRRRDESRDDRVHRGPDRGSVRDRVGHIRDRIADRRDQQRHDRDPRNRGGRPGQANANASGGTYHHGDIGPNTRIDVHRDGGTAYARGGDALPMNGHGRLDGAGTKPLDRINTDPNPGGSIGGFMARPNPARPRGAQQAIREGESLRHFGERMYGNPRFLPRIYHLNRDLLMGRTTIPAGTKLKI